MKKNLICAVVFALILSFTFYGCVEHRYYRGNNHHSEKHHKKHPKMAPRGIDIDIHK